MKFRMIHEQLKNLKNSILLKFGFVWNWLKLLYEFSSKKWHIYQRRYAMLRHSKSLNSEQIVISTSNLYSNTLKCILLYERYDKSALGHVFRYLFIPFMRTPSVFKASTIMIFIRPFFDI